VDEVAVVEAPVGAVPHQPFFPQHVVPDTLSVFGHEPVCVGGVGELQQSFLQLLQPQEDAFIANVFSFHRNSPSQVVYGKVNDLGLCRIIDDKEGNTP